VSGGLLGSQDVVVIGGSFAGLSAAVYLARTRRPVCVVDAGSPRNRFASASHGFLSRDGSDPAAMLMTARQQLACYPSATVVNDEAIGVHASESGFAVALRSGALVHGRKLVLAFGVSDVLPELPGLAERWGKTVLHCPYCHGYEFAEKRQAVLYLGPRSIHQALLIADWGPTTLLMNGAAMPDEASRQRLARRGVRIEPGAVAALVGDGSALSGAAMLDGQTLAFDVLYVSTFTRLNSDAAERLGCAVDEGPLGPIVRTDVNRLTTVEGVFAAGDIARAPHSVTWAAADGVTAGIAAHQALVHAATLPGDHTNSQNS
jgi:thioredoxin reductase